jgi:hypothetical protein
MGTAKNTLDLADVSSTPIKLRYAATYASNSLANYGITSSSVQNYAYTASMPSDRLDSMNKYRMIRQVYYQQYITGSVLGSASFFDPFWVSTAASGTYDATVYHFPTGSGQKIIIFAIPPSQFGEQVSRNSFRLKTTGVSSQFDIIDDGNGNLIDTLASNHHVGNIFYGQGIAVITDDTYITPPPNPTPIILQQNSTNPDYLITQAGDQLIIQTT